MQSIDRSVTLAGNEADLVMNIIVDYPIPLLLDIPDDRRPRRTRERQAISIRVIHRNEIIRSRKPQIRPTLKMQRDRRHIHRRQPRKIITSIEQREPRCRWQIQRTRAKRVTQRGVRSVLETRDGRAGVDDDAPVAERVELEGVGRDREERSPDADARHFEVVKRGHAGVAGLGGEACAGGGDCGVAEDERGARGGGEGGGVGVAVGEAVGEAAAELRVDLVGEGERAFAEAEEARGAHEVALVVVAAAQGYAGEDYLAWAGG